MSERKKAPSKISASFIRTAEGEPAGLGEDMAEGTKEKLTFCSWSLVIFIFVIIESNLLICKLLLLLLLFFFEKRVGELDPLGTVLGSLRGLKS